MVIEDDEPNDSESRRAEDGGALSRRRLLAAAGAAPDPKTGKRPPVYVKEPAAWSAVRNATHSCGFAAFAVDPGAHPGDATTIRVTCYDVVGLDGRLQPFEFFTLRRPRRD